MAKSILIIIIALLLAFNAFFYFSYVRPSKMFIPEMKNKSEVISYSQGFLQFYPNMRFNHNLITFRIEESCAENKKLRMRQAFNFLENETKYIEFREVLDNEDISVTCDETKTRKTPDAHHFVAGEGGAESIVNTSLFYVIEKGAVLLYYKEEKSCINFNIELHELLHVFGFQHSENEDSIMYPTVRCNQVLSEDIINEINQIYSIQPEQDIYISNVSASKHGAYLDFSIQVRNQGLTGASNIILVLSSEEKEISTYELEDIDYGEGKTLSVQNQKVPISLLTMSEITFKVESKGSEIDSDNNEVTLHVA